MIGDHGRKKQYCFLGGYLAIVIVLLFWSPGTALVIGLLLGALLYPAIDTRRYILHRDYLRREHRFFDTITKAETIKMSRVTRVIMVKIKERHGDDYGVEFIHDEGIFSLHHFPNEEECLKVIDFYEINSEVTQD
ncbi:hypothetical protein ACFPK9_09745 [Rubritalea spongiae]|uniref:DUF304 domain-containing protein n=1 Tax=Rubritalea spongiae TaxID=430797 RepID=A0ABW5E411_9BACT